MLITEKGKFKALLVDDDRTAVMLYGTILEGMGLMVDRAADGAEAVELSQKKKYDLIFMDIDMPKMNGYEATRTIRELERQSGSTYIIGLTATLSKKEHVDLCISSGMNDCLAKPSKQEAIHKKLLRWQKQLFDSKAKKAQES